MSHTMCTRSTHQLCTRSGMRYQRPQQENHFVALPTFGNTNHSNPYDTFLLKGEVEGEGEVETQDVLQDMEVEFAKTEDNKSPDVLCTFEVYHPNGEVEIKYLNFEEWKEEVKKHLRNTYEMTEDEVEDYPFYNWFLENKQPLAIANRIRREFFRDEDQYYVEPFYQWLGDVDKLIVKHLGLNREDLPDFPFYDCFDEMVTPMEMVNYMRENLLFI